MITDAGNQFDFVGQLHQIVICSNCKSVALDLGVILGGEHDDGYFGGSPVGPKQPHQIQTLDGRHHQVLKNYSRLDVVSFLDGFHRIGAVVKIDVRQVGQ